MSLIRENGGNMATFVERIDGESDYTKVFNVIKLGFKDGEIFNRQLVTEKFMQHYGIDDRGEANRVIKQELERVITNLASYSKVKRLSNGQYILCLKKKSKEEQTHENKEMII